MSTIQTRLATPADIDVLVPLFDDYRQFYARPSEPDLARRFLRERLRHAESVIILALTEAHGVGFCQLYPSFCSVEAKPIYILYDLFVAPEARRFGAARALLQMAEQLAVRHGKARMDLATAKSNRAAQAVYRSMGWTRDELFYTYNKRIEV